MCTASLESMAIEVDEPTLPDVSMEMVTQEPVLSVAYLMSILVASK